MTVSSHGLPAERRPRRRPLRLPASLHTPLLAALAAALTVGSLLAIADVVGRLAGNS